jgi:hypothetical protein
MGSAALARMVREVKRPSRLVCPEEQLLDLECDSRPTALCHKLSLAQWVGVILSKSPFY